MRQVFFLRVFQFHRSEYMQTYSITTMANVGAAHIRRSVPVSWLDSRGIRIDVRRHGDLKSVYTSELVLVAPSVRASVRV